MSGTLVSHTLVDLLRGRAERQPEQLAYTFLAEDGTVRVTYGELDKRARAFGAMLQEMDAAGQRAVLLYPPGMEYIVAFFGCLYAGVQAVPAYPPRLNGNLERLQAVVSDSNATIALTTSTILTTIERKFADFPEMNRMKWLATDAVALERADRWQVPLVTSDALAFLQYTSGSTSAPKGVMLSHGNLLHNLQVIQERFETSENSRGVVWLPPYHDMGLIGGILQPLYTGYPMTLMAPVTFIQRPLTWLQAISDTKATVSGGPNFAFDLCVQKITPEQRDRLDLSSWEQAFTGAEPIRAETLERFADYFAPAGFRKEAFYACYGLAEGTLFVTGGLNQAVPVVKSFEADLLEQNVVQAATAESGVARTLVSSGQVALSGQRVEIVHPETSLRCAEDAVGEIWVSGPSVAQGYWNRPELTEETFQGHLADTGEGPFLRTGDLGFVREGELFVTGRMKDLIIIRGRNYYPQDIELSVQQSHAAVRNSNGAAFSVDVDGEEKLVVVQEVERQYRKGNHEEVIMAVRQAVGEEHQLQVHAVVLIKPASIPKTSSGKIQRHACRDRFLAGTLEVVVSDVIGGHLDVAVDGAIDAEMLDDADVQRLLNRLLIGENQGLFAQELLEIAPEMRAVVVESYLLSEAANVLKVAPGVVKVEQPLTALGLDSLMAVDLKNRLEEQLGVVVSLSSFLEGASVAQLAAEVLSQVERSATLVEAHRQHDATEYPLAYGQRSLWFLQRLAPGSAAYNIGGAARIREAVDVAAMERAFAQLVQRHAVLRTNFATADGNPIQRVKEQVEAYFTFENATEWREQDLQDRLVAEAYRPFDLEQDALFRVHLFQRGAEDFVLQVTTHHIVADFWSVGVLVQELQEVYAAEKAGRVSELAPNRHGYVEFVEHEAQLLAGDEGEKMWSYWQDKLSGELPILALPTDFPRPPVQTYDGAAVTFRLPAELSKAAKRVAKEQGVTFYTLFLAVLQVLLHRYTGQEDILVGSPTTGRNRAKFAELVGDFVNPIV
ncbi:MAG: condensation domain-containing protein, partial [Tumebacillaceae bacterium]